MGRNIECTSWVQTPINVLPQSMPGCMQYHIIPTLFWCVFYLLFGDLPVSSKTKWRAPGISHDWSNHVHVLIDNTNQFRTFVKNLTILIAANHMHTHGTYGNIFGLWTPLVAQQVVNDNDHNCFVKTNNCGQDSIKLYIGPNETYTLALHRGASFV